MKTLRWAGTVAVGLGTVALLAGCPAEKKPEPKAPVAEATPTPTPTPPPEPKAEPACAAALAAGTPAEVTIGARKATSNGARLTFADADADSLVLGVLGPLNEDSGENMVALKKYLKFFKDEKADAIIITGDMGEDTTKPESFTRILELAASSGVPVFTIIGNGECRQAYADGVAAAQAKASNIVNMNQVRAVEFPELTILSLPGYHEPKYIKCGEGGCQYFPSTVREVLEAAQAAKGPVALLAHGPPHGEGQLALDYAAAGGNVGDEAVAKLLTDGKFKLGFFSNIKEAGGRASADVAGTQLVKEGAASDSLFLNPGPADTSVAWDMNDGTKGLGMAAIVSLKEGKASWKGLRLKAMSAADKAEAKKLAPPAPAP